MANYIETKVRFEKMLDNGVVKRVAEPYLIDALTFTEAEANIIEKVRPYISGDFSVEAVKKTKIMEIYPCVAGGDWYLVKVAFITLDERSGTEKETIAQYMVQASDFDSAVVNFKDAMKGTLGDWAIKGISLTKILDVFSHNDIVREND